MRTHEHAKKHRQTEIGRFSAARRNHRRRARKLDAMVEGQDMTPEQWQRILKNQHGKCNLCGKKFIKSRPATMDHIIPLSKGGPHLSSNVQALCQSCNSSKNAKIIKKFIISWTL